MTHGSVAADIRRGWARRAGAADTNETPAQTAAGAHTFTWDGKGINGATMPDGAYTYNRGWNWRAVIATLLGCAAAWISCKY